MKPAHLILPILFTLCTAPSLAQETHSKTPDAKKTYEQLSRNEYVKLLPGKTIKGEYRFMRERTKTFNFAEEHFADGTTNYREGTLNEKGVWYPLGKQKICYKYPDSPAMGGNTNCFWVYESEKCYYGYSISEMTLKGPRDYNDWVARWVMKGTGGSCDTPVS